MVARSRLPRARTMVNWLKKHYPVVKTELLYETPMQLVAAVMLSAQCTDKHVNKVTRALFQKYKSVDDFASADVRTFTSEISSIPFFRNKARAIIGTAKLIRDQHEGHVPHSEAELVQMPGIAYKTAHVVLGELYDQWDGIPTDTHVKRFALKFGLTTHTDLAKISKDLEALVPKKDWKYVNNGLVLYGRYTCPARPHDCTGHPLTRALAGRYDALLQKRGKSTSPMAKNARSIPDPRQRGDAAANASRSRRAKVRSIR